MILVLEKLLIFIKKSSATVVLKKIDLSVAYGGKDGKIKSFVEKALERYF
ncbi:hypothetical protein [Candidatus Endomicrobiellum trichonymphae]